MPLRYVSAAEMERVLKSMAPLSTISRVDTARNLLVLTGTGSELTSMLDTINVFDVDYMRGMSFGIFPIESPDPAAFENEISYSGLTRKCSAVSARMPPIERGWLSREPLRDERPVRAVLPVPLVSP